MTSWYRWDEKAKGPELLINILVQPKSRRNEIIGVHGDALKVRITAPPVDGKANQQICDFIADICGVKKAHVQVESGPSSRSKCLRISLPEKAIPAGLSNY